MDRLPKTGADLIRDERFRQVADEGWTPEHDDTHTGNELVDAAVCYLLYSKTHPDHMPISWPWEDEAWRPSPEHVVNLVRAGALIAAEIDRLDRAASDT
jgi:hypothetical protein